MKHDGVRQWVADDIPYMKWKHKFHGLKPPFLMGKSPFLMGKSTIHGIFNQI